MLLFSLENQLGDLVMLFDRPHSGVADVLLRFKSGPCSKRYELAIQ